MGKAPKHKPSWWLFYLVWVVMTGLLVWDYWAPWSPVWQNICAMVIMLAAYTMIALWLHANRSTLRQADELKRQRLSMPPRDVPLSPLQAQYLTVMERYSKQ